jgi:hypothetical protein
MPKQEQEARVVGEAGNDEGTGDDRTALTGDRLRPVSREDTRNIQALQQTAGPNSFLELQAHRRPAAAELSR